MRRMAGIPERLVNDLDIVLIRRQYSDRDSLSLVQLRVLGN
jgi:hypothetical protein